MKIHVVTLFPEFFDSPLRAGIPGRAAQAGLVEFGFANPRDFATDRHRTVDDTPYGGGAGMVLKPEPLVQSVESITGAGNPRQLPVILLSPQGPVLSQRKAQRLAAQAEVVFVCGRYKAIDERVRDLVITEELSVGDFVLSGGEPACLLLVDAIVRLLPGALGDQDSADSDSFASHWRGGLDCAYYTRPEVYRGRRVPDVLLSGHHERIASWRRLQAQDRTRRKRPDLLHPASEA
jgi:tRNA (guanine37-N1)-methyltransferase